MTFPRIQPGKPLRRDLIYHCLRPIDTVSRVFGASYFNVRKSVLSRISNKIYTLTFFILFTGSFFYRIISVPPQFCQPDAVAHSVVGIQQILAIIVVITIYYQVLFYKDQFKELLKSISSTENEFSVLNLSFSNERFVIKNLFEVIFITAFIYASFIIFVIYYKVRDIGFILLELFTSINSMLVIILNLMVFTNLAWFIRNRLQILKHFLMDVCAIDSLVAHDSSEVWKVKLTRETPHGLHREFKKIAQIYELLFAMVNNLNDIFGFSNLTSMALFSISLTCHLFLLFKLLTENTNNMNDIQFDVLASIIWIILLTVPLVYASIICHLVVCEATEIATVMNETIAGDKIGDVSQIDLELISLQFLHQKPQFSACGFFSIDMTFVYAVSGAVTTYLVILLQFNYG